MLMEKDLICTPLITFFYINKKYILIYISLNQMLFSFFFLITINLIQPPNEFLKNGNTVSRKAW